MVASRPWARGHEWRAARWTREIQVRPRECAGRAETSYWVTEAPWDPEASRSLLVDIAEDRLRALWFDSASGEVYAPYDGGADLILSSPERRAHLRREFSAWLSARPDGL